MKEPSGRQLSDIAGQPQQRSPRGQLGVVVSLLIGIYTSIVWNPNDERNDHQSIYHVLTIVCTRYIEKELIAVS